MYLATSFTVSGAHGFLIVVAGIIFIIAAVLAIFAGPPRLHQAVGSTATGLAVYMLALLFSG